MKWVFFNPNQPRRALWLIFLTGGLAARALNFTQPSLGLTTFLGGTMWVGLFYVAYLIRREESTGHRWWPYVLPFLVLHLLQSEEIRSVPDTWRPALEEVSFVTMVLGISLATLRKQEMGAWWVLPVAAGAAELSGRQEAIWVVYATIVVVAGVRLSQLPPRGKRNPTDASAQRGAGEEEERVGSSGPGPDRMDAVDGYAEKTQEIISD